MDKALQYNLMGFDILPMSSSQRFEGVRLAVSVKLVNQKTKHWSQVSRSKLFKLVDQYNIRYIGTDNPAEVLNEGEEIGNFAKLLPSTCELVHVNLTRSGNTVPLKSLLQQYNIAPRNRKLSAAKTAEALIQLMEFGVGMVLEPFENETLIEVGRPKGSSKGGWSQARYQRQSEEVVKREALKILEKLEQGNIPFDSNIQETKYGAKRARFHIFKSKSEIDSVIKNLSVYPAKMRIWSPKKRLVTHRPLDKSQPPHRSLFYNQLQRLIVGVDPGMTTGVAVANLSGKIITVFSRKNLSKGQLVSEITKYGVPVLICADVAPIPTFVNKFANTYNAELYAPDVELSRNDKRQLANKAKVNLKLDSHEIDALAAVMRGYQKYQPHFNKIDTHAISNKQKELAKGLIIRGLSVTDSIRSIKILERKESQPEKAEYEVTSNGDSLNPELLGRISNLLEEIALSEDIISNLRAHTGRLKSENSLIKNRMQRLKAKNLELQNEETRKILGSDIITSKEKQIAKLRKDLVLAKNVIHQRDDQISKLQDILWVTLEQGGLPVKILQKFSHEEIEKLVKNHSIIDGDIILILDPTGAGSQTANKLAQYNIKFIFTKDQDMPENAFDIFYMREIPVMRAEKYNIITTTFLGLINQKNLLQAEEDYKKYVIQRKTKERESKIFQTIENYKYERSKELLGTAKNYDDFEPVELEEEDIR